MLQLQARRHQAGHRVPGAPREALRGPEGQALLPWSHLLYVHNILKERGMHEQLLIPVSRHEERPHLRHGLGGP